MPTILVVVDTDDGSLEKSYIYAGPQIVAQKVHDDVDPNCYDEYFYLHDRLGSVRQVIDPNMFVCADDPNDGVINTYT